MSETKIVKKIKDYVNSLAGFWVWKTHGDGYSTPGIADLIGITPNGRFIAIEVKKPETKNNLSIAQKYFLRAIENKGGISMMAYSVECVQKKLKMEKII